MDMADKVNKVISIPMLAIDAVCVVAAFQNSDVTWGICMVFCCAWWMYVIYKLFILEEQ